MYIKIFKNNTNLIFMILVVFFVFTKSAFASLVINEVMYDPIGSNSKHQWVEVYNNSLESLEVDALKWRLNDGSSHYINDKKKFSINANSFIVLTADKNTFLSDHAGYSGVVIDTVLSLDKDGDTVSIINDGVNVDSFSFTSSMGASENGKSLQKINGTWLESKPNPGYINQISVDPVVNNPNPKIDKSKKVISKKSTKKTVNETYNTFPEVVVEQNVVDLDKKENDIPSSISNQDKSLVSNKELAYTGLFVLIVSSFISLFYLKTKQKKQEIVSDSNDFKILE